MRLLRIMTFLAISLLLQYGISAQEASKDKDAAKPKEETPAKPAETKEDSTFSKIKVVNWDDGKEKPKIEDESQNLIVDDKGDAPAKQKITSKKAPPKMPADSFAAKIAMQDKVIEWRPQWRTKGIGSAWLPDAALSEDCSALAVVETLGRESGPFGSRIMFIETYTFNQIRFIEIDRYIKKILFIPKTDYILCWCERQFPLKQPYSLQLIDCKNGKVISSSTSLREQVSSIVCDANGMKLYIKSADSEDLYIYRAQDLMTEPVKLKLPFRGGSMAISADDSILGISNGNSIELFRTEDLKPASTVKLPDDFRIKTFKFMNSNTSFLVLSEEGKAMYIKGDIQKNVANYAGGIIVFDPKTSIVGLGKENKSEYALFTFPSFDEIEVMSPYKTKPATLAHPTEIFYLSGRNMMLFIDEHGNFFTMHKSGKKWVKTLYISALK